MKIIKSITLMQRYSKHLKARRKTIGFVPTMGYLHNGHMSLVRRSVKENDETIVSIFVNPLQFGPTEDFEKYPRDFKRDERMLKKAGADVVFYPTQNQMYRQPYYTYVNVQYLTDTLCGRSRPGHFKGVTTVVAKLFNIIRPDIAYFGQKDAQQAIVIKKMTEDLNMDIRIKVMPIIRESDGLAMSSRNIYLTPQERADAAVLHQALLLAKRMIKKGQRLPGKIITKMSELINQKKSSRIDYIEIVNPKTLRPVKNICGEILIAMAVYIGKTRLIDNLKLKVR
ncbi:MAG: pantoate--beta-alanine ligase [Candidatus Omnitrophica bacterium]|nr:pantoate--beta-alanine ligase [Candidatus Omnitrophota bacterium]